MSIALDWIVLYKIRVKILLLIMSSFAKTAYQTSYYNVIIKQVFFY